MAHNGTANETNGDVDSGYTVPLLIGGKEVKPETTFDVTSPSNEKLVWRAHSASVNEAESAVKAALAAFPEWSHTNPSQRRDIFLRAADIFEKRKEELSDIMQNETGATAHWAGFNLVTTIGMLKDIAGRIAGAVEGSIPWCEDAGSSALVIKEPYGVILGIAPWNAPYILGVRAIAYPLAAGNTAIFKGSELSPRTAYAIGSIFAEAGLPSGALNVLFHSPQAAAEVTTALIADPAVKKINFTGSTHVGSIIAQAAGKHIKPVLLELGGKAPAVVLADADLQKTAQACAVGSFFHAGQICMSTERIIVDSSIKDKFAEVFTKTVDGMFGSKTEAPVLITAAGVTKARKLVESALAAGAKSLTGTPDFTETSRTRMRPIIVEGVTKDMDLYYAETFGPHVTLSTFSTEAEAIELANDTEYGLAAAVFTENLSAGLRVARQIESGAVHINHMTVHDEPRLPHGGAKASGFGRFGGAFGIEEFLRTKTITFPN